MKEVFVASYYKLYETSTHTSHLAWFSFSFGCMFTTLLGVLLLVIIVSRKSSVLSIYPLFYIVGAASPVHQVSWFCDGGQPVLINISVLEVILLRRPLTGIGQGEIASILFSRLKKNTLNVKNLRISMA